MSQHPPDPLYVFRGGMNVVSCLTYGPQEVIYAGTQNGFVHVWDLKTNRQQCSFKAGGSTCLSIHAYAENIVIQIKGGSITVWSVSRGEYIKQKELSILYLGFCRLELHKDFSHALIFAPSENSVIKSVNLEILEVLNSFECSSYKLGEVMVMKQSVLSSNLFLLAGYESGHIILWNVHNCSFVSDFKIDATPMAIDFDSEKRMGICGSESDNVFLFTLDERNNSLSAFKTIKITNPGVSCIRIREDRKLFVLGCWDGRIRVFSWKSLRLLAVLTGHSESLHDLCFSPEIIPSWRSKYLLATASKDKSISLWSIYED